MLEYATIDRREIRHGVEVCTILPGPDLPSYGSEIKVDGQDAILLSVARDHCKVSGRVYKLLVQRL